MKKQEIYTIDNNRIDKLINNMYIPVNQQNDYLYSTINNTLTPQAIEKAISTAAKAWEDVQKLNEQISLADDGSLRTSLKQEKNAICKKNVEHLTSCHRMTQDKNHQVGFGNYIIKFFRADEDGEFSLIMKKYSHFSSGNELNNKMILEIRHVYEELKEKINQSMNDKNIGEDVQQYSWQRMLPSYNQLLEKIKVYEKSIKTKQESILNINSLSLADHYNRELERDYNKIINELNFDSNQLVKRFVAKGFEVSGQSFEESPVILEIKEIIDGFKKKIDKNLTDNDINQKIKSAVFKLFKSKFDQHLDQLKQIEKSIKQTENTLIYSNNLENFKSTQNNLKHYQQKIDKWKLESDKLTEEIINKAIEFSYQTGQVQSVLNEPQLIQPVVNIVPNQQSNLIIEESEMDSVIDDSLSIITTNSMILNQSSSHIVNPIIANEGSVAILKIKSLLDGFEKKLNDSLNDNSNIINEKIKSAIYKIYHPKCKKHLEKLELIEESIKKYKDLPISEKITKHLGQRYKQIDKWELDSDDLIEKITIKAIELSCKTQPEVNQQNNLPTQTILDQIAELNKNIVEMNQNNMEIPPIEQVYQEGSSNFQFINPLEDSKFEKSMSMYSDGSYGIVKESSKKDKIKEAVKTEKKRCEIKGEIKLIKMGIKAHFEGDEIKEDLKYTKNHLPEIKSFFENHNDLYIAKGNESLLIGELEDFISDVE